MIGNNANWVTNPSDYAFHYIEPVGFEDPDWILTSSIEGSRTAYRLNRSGLWLTYHELCAKEGQRPALSNLE